MWEYIKGLIRPVTVERTGDDSPTDTVWGYVWRMTGFHQVAACVVALVVAALNLAPLELQRRLIDDAIGGADLDLLYLFGGLYIGAFLSLRVLKFGLRLYQGWMAESAVRYTRQHLLGIYCERNRETDDRRPGEAVNVINTETDKLGGFVGGDISQAVSNAAMALGIVGYMFYTAPTVALAALAVLVPQMAVAPFMQNYLNCLTEERLGYLRNLGQQIAEDDICAGERTMGRLDAIFGNQMKFYIWKYLLKAVLNLLNGAGPIIVLTYGGWLAIQGETTVGVLVAFISGFDKLSSPARELITFYRNAEQARVQHDMIAAWMTSDPSRMQRGRDAEQKAAEDAEREEARTV